MTVSVIVPPCWWRRHCYGERRQPNSPTHRIGCSPTRRCSRPRRNRSPRTGHVGWPASRCTTRPVRSVLSLQHCGIRLRYVVGSDIDPVRLAMAGHNVAGVDLCRADALRPVTRDTVVLVDPARRSGGRRRFDPRDYMPALDALLDVYRGRDLVVKCAPGIDFDELSRLGFRGEIEVTSLAGSVREACLWSAGLAGDGVTRRATMLDTGEGVTDADPDDCTVAPAGRWIVDPDGAVVRAGLVRHYAARHGLWQLDPDIAYLSGDRLPDERARVRSSRGADLQRTATAPGAFGARRRRRRDPGSRCRCRPRRVAGTAAAARVATGLGRHRPHRIRGGKPGNGIHLSSLTVRRHVPWQ